MYACSLAHRTVGALQGGFEQQNVPLAITCDYLEFPVGPHLQALTGSRSCPNVVAVFRLPVLTPSRKLHDTLGICDIQTPCKLHWSLVRGCCLMSSVKSICGGQVIPLFPQTDTTITHQLNLCDMPGEIQDQVILSLHPSAMVALGQTSRHFNEIASSHRLDRKSVDDFVHERRLRIRWARDFFCGFCYTAKPPNEFTMGHITGKHPKNGMQANKRSCIDCMIARSTMLPGHVVVRAWRQSVYCVVYLSLQDRFCTRCNWCFACA